MIHLIDFFNPIKLAWKLTFFGGSDSPPPPDYVGAAKAQGAANLDAAIASGIINNPNTYTPFGSQNVTWDYERNKKGQVVRAVPTINQRLSPEQQALYNKSLISKGNLSDAAISGSNAIKGMIGSGVSFAGAPRSQVPGLLAYNAPNYQAIGQYQGSPQYKGIGQLNAPEYRDIGQFNGGPQYQSVGQFNGGPEYNAINAPKDRVLDTSQKRRMDVVNAMMARVDTDTAGQRNSKNSELIAAGLRPGTAAYKSAMDQIDRQYNDARNQALLAGGQEASRDFAMDQAARQQEMADYGQKYDANARDYGIRRDAAVQNYGINRDARVQDYGLQRDAAVENYGIRQNANAQNFGIRQDAAAQNFGLRQNQNVQDYGIRQAAGLQDYTTRQNANAQNFGIQQNAAAQNYGIRQNAAAQNFEQSQEARRQYIAELLSQRQTPLNEINAIMSGSQINNPFAGGLGYQAGANVQAAPIAQGVANQGQAAMNQFNAQQAAFNGNVQAGAGLLGSLGSAWLMS